MSQRERLAALEHEQWAAWTRHLLETLRPVIEAAMEKDYERALETGNMDCAPWLQAVHRWERQIKTPYEDLTEKEKDSDREWADKVLAELMS